MKTTITLHSKGKDVSDESTLKIHYYAHDNTIRLEANGLYDSKEFSLDELDQAIKIIKGIPHDRTIS